MNKPDVRPMINVRFGRQADKIKISRKAYSIDLESMSLSGRSEALEEIIKRHKDKPYGTIEEVIGDVQLLLLSNWNEFHRLWPTSTRSLTLEEVLKDQKYL